MLSNKAYDNLKTEKVITRKELLKIIRDGERDKKNGNFTRVTSLSELN